MKVLAPTKKRKLRKEMADLSNEVLCYAVSEKEGFSVTRKIAAEILLERDMVNGEELDVIIQNVPSEKLKKKAMEEKLYGSGLKVEP